MRIIAGTLGGHIIHEPHGHKTHPMSEKVRGALFNILGDVEGLTFLDAFSGTGALAVEAVSRGAKHVVAIDQDRAAHSTLDKNITEHHLQKQIDSVRANVGGWSIHNMEKRYDILLLDPPFEDIQEATLSLLIKRHVKKKGLAVLSCPGKYAAPEFESTQIVAEKTYGDAKLVFYRKIK